jgi:hypothetical protein
MRRISNIKDEGSLRGDRATSRPLESPRKLCRCFRPEELKSAADQTRGILETIAGVIAPDPPDLEAMKLVGEIILRFLNEDGLQSKKLLCVSLLALSADDTVMSDIDEFHNILRDIAKCLEQGQVNKIREFLVTARQVLDLSGKDMQNKLRDVVFTNKRWT